MGAMMNKISILGVDVNNLKFKEVETDLINTLKEKGKKTVFTPNTEIIMMCQKDLELRKIINSGDIVTPDGIGLIYASKLYKAGLEERVTGFDLSMKLLEISKEGYKIFVSTSFIFLIISFSIFSKSESLKKYP